MTTSAANKTPERSVTTIILTADDSYLRYVPCNIAQLARFGRHADGVILAVPPRVDEALIALVRSTAYEHGMALEVATVSALESLLKNRLLPGLDWMSYFTYAKLVLAETFTGINDALYLDIDTLVRAPLDELLDWRLNHPVGAVYDWGSGGAHLFGTPQRPYFNAGVMRLSLDVMRSEKIWNQAVRILETRDLPVVDQDVLNLIFSDRFDVLPLTYNVFDTLTPLNRQIKAFRDPVIVHFVGPSKPWHESATSQFAEEWRRWYSQTGAGADLCDEHDERPGKPIDSLSQSRGASRGRLGSTARAVLPASAKQAAKRAAIKAASRVLSRFQPAPPAVQMRPVPSVYSIASATANRAAIGHNDADSGLDLLISLARSGTNALGSAIQLNRPEVHWLNELYLGIPDGLGHGELLDRFPWFSDGDPVGRAAMTPEARSEAMTSFAATMSEHAVDLTRAVLGRRQGRTLIKVFPEQLSPAAFQEVLLAFRPRLLFLRRDLVFSYISLRRAMETGSWWNSDLTYVPFTLTDRSALKYAVNADGWIDFVTHLAVELNLESVWLTYNGLFDTGRDIALLESFYPGPAMGVDEAGRLRSGFRIQDRRSDASVLDALVAVSRLSTTTQSHLLRLPGNYVNELGEINAQASRLVADRARVQD